MKFIAYFAYSMRAGGLFHQYYLSVWQVVVHVGRCVEPRNHTLLESDPITFGQAHFGVKFATFVAYQIKPTRKNES